LQRNYFLGDILNLLRKPTDFLSWNYRKNRYTISFKTRISIHMYVSYVSYLCLHRKQRVKGEYRYCMYLK
jgi:hypothetical protein